ncbi:MAG: glycosyltransferase [Candidatus Rokubacteria bacterium]|nr:glycosyltransferase [Candidatus Rokubacteria bacterium]
MRVVHVIDNLAPGGTEKQCLELARGLVALGADSRVLYLQGGPLLAELEASGLAAHAVPVGSFRSPRFPRNLARLAGAIRHLGPDVVQTYGFYSNLPGLLAAWLARVPVRVGGRRDLGAHLRPVQRRADRAGWRLADRVVVNSESVRRDLVVHGVTPAKLVVVRNGVNLALWPAPVPPAVEGDATVGMVAHFREQKDHVTFLRAAAEVIRRVPAIRFVLVGSGPLEAAMRKRAREMGIADRVEFLGRLEGEALRAAVRRLRVSVLTSKNNEGLPNAVLESMAAGLPVVATPIGGTPEVVEDGLTGFLVPPGDPAALAERIVLLLKDPSMARAMGEKGRRRIAREFPVQRMVSEFHVLYQQLLQRKRG